MGEFSVCDGNSAVANFLDQSASDLADRVVAARASEAGRVRWEEAMFRLLGFMFVLCLVGQPSFGDDGNKVLGTWKLVSYETEVQATGEKEPAMGQKPDGYVLFNAEGRVFLVVTGEARKPAKTSHER